MANLLRKLFLKKSDKSPKTQKNVLINCHPRLVALNQKLITSKAKS